MARSTPTARRQAERKSLEGLVAASRAGSRATTAISPFAFPEHPPGVIPPDVPAMAQDAALKSAADWATTRFAQDAAQQPMIIAPFAAQGIYNQAFANGYGFAGYSYLAQLAQIAEYRVVTETIAAEMTREWVELKSTGDDDKTDKLKALGAAMDKFSVQEVFRKCAEADGFFGRGHLYIDTGDTDDRAELPHPIGDGRNELSRAKIAKGSLKALRAVEPVWCYPTQYDSNDPLKPDWYAPRTWFCMGKELHATRLLTFIGREVPDLLKPAYSFGGLSLSQMVKPYVDNWLRTRQSVSDLIWSFSTMGLKTNMQELLSPGGEQLLARITAFNNFRNNRGTMLVDKDSEELFNVVTPLGTLDALQAQSQEHMAAASRIPLVKLLGIQPAGLNASSEGEIRSFYDWIKAFQELMFRRPLTAVLGFIQLSEFGEVDPEITFDFVDLWQLDEAGKSAVEKTKADTHDAYIAMGAVVPEEVRKALAADPESAYAGLDLDATPPPTDPSEEDLGEEVDEHGQPLGAGEGGTSTVPRVKDPGNRLATSLTSKAANFGGATSGGFREAAE